MIPAQAVEAAAKAAYEVMPVELFGEDGPVLWEHLSDSILGNSRKHHELDRARAALEAAAPHMLAHEREQTRLAHLDAMVNRETKRDELAAEYRRGYRDGLADRKQVTDEVYEATRLLSRNYPDTPPGKEPAMTQPIAAMVEALPEAMKARREELGLSMLAAAKAVSVPMMTYRRFELGERDRLRLPHVVRMLRWLEVTK